MHERFTSPEEKELDSKVNLKITKRPGKNFMIAFNATTKADCQAYNQTIENILNKLNLSAYHQYGVSHDENEPGYHAWEIKQKIDPQELVKILPQIEEKAQKILNE